MNVEKILLWINEHPPQYEVSAFLVPSERKVYIKHNGHAYEWTWEFTKFLRSLGYDVEPLNSMIHEENEKFWQEYINAKERDDLIVIL